MKDRTEHKPLRPLGAFEQMFAGYGETNAMYFSIVAEVSGPMTELTLSKAVSQVAERHPLLQVSLGLDDESVSAFFPTQKPVQVTVSAVSSRPWQALVEQSLRSGPDSSLGPLWRVDAETDGNKTTLVLTFHHSIADGISGIVVLEEVVAALAGVKPEMAGLSASSDMLLGLPQPGFLFGPTPGLKDDKLLPTVRSLDFEADEASEIFAACKANGATVNSMLAVAFSRAHFQGPDLVHPTYRLMSPLNLKPTLAPADNVSLCISIALATFEDDRGDFWTAARSFGDGLGKWKTLEMARGVHSGMAARLHEDATIEAAKRRLVEAIPFDSILSNLGVVDVTGFYGEFTLEKLWAPAIRSVPGQDTLGVATFKGALRIVHTGVEGDAGLLGRVERILRALR